MSHFFGVVFLPRKTPRNKVEEAVAELVEKFNEGTEVPEYERKCGCIGRNARNEASREAVRRLGTINDLRERFYKVHKQIPYPAEKAGMTKKEKKVMWAEYSKAERSLEKAWRKAVAPFSELEKRLFVEHPDAKKPNPECSDCHGKGVHMTTYNPDSQWDWWVVGGRWTGSFTPDYDPAEDPRNIETCWICKGTGKRDDELGKEERKRNPAYTCNGCDGKGKSVKFSYAPHNGDVMPASEVPSSVTPFSIVTPDGEWHEKGEMGWFGCVSDEKEEGVWKKTVKKLFKKHADCLAVVVDYHI